MSASDGGRCEESGVGVDRLRTFTCGGMSRARVTGCLATLEVHDLRYSSVSSVIIYPSRSCTPSRV
jgi:hypothetical protein